MTEHSIEINGRIEEIQSCAAELPQGGDIEKLKIELTKLANWTNQTLLFIGRIEDKPCRCCPGDCDCKG